MDDHPDQCPASQWYSDMITCASRRSTRDGCVVGVQRPQREPCIRTCGCTQTENTCMPKPWARLFRVICCEHERVRLSCHTFQETTGHPTMTSQTRPVRRPRVLNPCCCKHSLRILPLPLQTRSWYNWLAIHDNENPHGRRWPRFTPVDQETALELAPSSISVASLR